ncbi:MAG: tRNA (adenosine(37)-N6)-threonylcarbamoyltransferase complex ATPase subunit type 1 TsaE [Mucilaginibacter sp.]
MLLSARSPSDLTEIASSIINYAGTEKIFLFFGEMGAGKTTFIKSLCAYLGVNEAVTSPTFSIVNEYVSTAGKIYHFDFYRLKNETEALDMGYEEYFYSGNYCFIEWPEKIAGLLPEHYIRIEIEVSEQHERLLTFAKI